AEQCFGHRLHHARLAGTSRPQKEEIAHGTAGRIQTSQIHLVDFHNFIDSYILADDLPPQGAFEILSVAPAPTGVAGSIKTSPNKLFLPRGGLTPEITYV